MYCAILRIMLIAKGIPTWITMYREGGGEGGEERGEEGKLYFIFRDIYFC